MVFLDWIKSIAGLAILVIEYIFLMPFFNYLVAWTTSMGAPAGTAYFLAYLLNLTFTIIGVGLIVLPFIAAYRRTHDQGYTDEYYYLEGRRQ